MKTLLLPSLLLLLWSYGDSFSAETVVVSDGKSLAAVYAPERILDDRDKNAEPASIWRTLKEEDNRRRLRESIYDFAAIVERMSGGQIDVAPGPPAEDDKRLPILVAELAEARFGKPGKSYPYGQGFRIVVGADAIGVVGESDLAVSYGLYTLLDQLGCRWFMPSDLGEVLPRRKTIAWDQQDLSSGPYTIYRGMWYCDNDFARRNRFGGMQLSAGHALEGSVPKELREEHPEIRAIIDGKPHARKVKWTHPLVAQAIAKACLAKAEKDPDMMSWSLSPDDGIGWDESDDAQHDAGDIDSATGLISKTDRLMLLAGRVADIVGKQQPDIKFGVLAYVDYTRPPVKVKVHPAVVPQIAPITFSRAHPMTDEGEPNNESLRYLVEGWGKKAAATSYYFYGYYLAEVSGPNPMLTKWGVDIPRIYELGACRYWQPETITNFETSLHAHYLGFRMAWNPEHQPQAIIDELNTRFYGAAATPMADYWAHIDSVWVDTPEYAGAGFGHLRRWTPEQLSKARSLLTAATSACRTPMEKRRVELASLSLAGFEHFMKLRRDLAAGRFDNLANDAEAYRERMNQLGEDWQPQFCFAKMGWTRDRSLNVRYFDAFYNATYVDAARIAKEHQLVGPPLRTWRYHPDPEKQGEKSGWSAATLSDGAWKTTDSAVDTWSSLDLHGYMGSLWYRQTVTLPEIADGEKLHLWLAATDGSAKVFVNGKHIPYIDDQGKPADEFRGFCKPASFDITSAAAPGKENQITILCTREFLNELGTGGLLGPARIYRSK